MKKIGEKQPLMLLCIYWTQIFLDANTLCLGCLAGSFGRACCSRSQGDEFEPHVGHRTSLKTKKPKYLMFLSGRKMYFGKLNDTVN